VSDNDTSHLQALQKVGGSNGWEGRVFIDDCRKLAGTV